MIAGCKEDQTPNPPVAEFSANNNFCVEPCTLTFYNNSQFFTSVSWEFGNGQTSTDSIVEVGYESAGKYSVTLEAQNVDGVTDTELKEITILPLQTMRFDTLQLVQIPKHNANQNLWDGTDDPDVYIALLNESDTVYSSSVNFWPNIDNTFLPLNILPNQGIGEKLEQYKLLVIDKDGLSGEIIAAFSFYQYDYKDYPVSINFVQDSTILKAAITWE